MREAVNSVLRHFLIINKKAGRGVVRPNNGPYRLALRMFGLAVFRLVVVGMRSVFVRGVFVRGVFVRRIGMLCRRPVGVRVAM